MRFRIKGKHTADYGDFPYEKFEECSKHLRNEHCNAIERIEPNDGGSADIVVTASMVKDMKVSEVIEWLKASVRQAKKDLSWECWDEESIG
jgi:hypothetical protein